MRVNIFDTKRKYGVIYMDPPWGKVTMKDMFGLPIKALAENDCSLFLWVPVKLLSEADRLVRGWGFDGGKALGLTWLRPNDEKGDMSVCMSAGKKKGGVIRFAVEDKDLKYPGRHFMASSKAALAQISCMFWKYPKLGVYVADADREKWDTWNDTQATNDASAAEE